MPANEEQGRSSYQSSLHKESPADDGRLRPFWADPVTEETPPARRSVRRIAAVAMIFGLLGGSIGSFAFIRYFADQVPVARQRLVLQENSNIIQVAERVMPSVVSITTSSTATGPFGIPQSLEGAGTGIILTSDGLILTNKHVVPEDTGSLIVYTSDGKEYRGAQVVSRDPLNDIAFIRVQAKGLKPAEIGSSESVKVGQRVLAIGNALGQFRNSVTDGIISGLGRPVAAASEGGPGGEAELLEDLFQTDAAINQGNSGGPLVNMAGQVIGINTAVAGQAQNIGFAIPIDQARSAIASVKEKGRIERPYIGVRYVSLDPQLASRYNLSVSNGAYIQSDGGTPGVLPGSPAEVAGLREGDIITKINGTDITSRASLSTVTGRFKAGDRINVTYRRGGDTKTTQLTLGTAPEAAQS